MGKVMSNMPKYYANSMVMSSLAAAEDNELARFTETIQATLNQFFVDTSDFTLDRWEKEFGIRTNPSKPLADRRSVIKSKMRGSGTITINLIKNITESYTNGSVEVTENNAEYSFTITFVDDRGIPPNLPDLQAAIEVIKPAHLAVIYEFTYNTYEYLNQFTYDFLKSFSYDQLRNEEIS